MVMNTRRTASVFAVFAVVVLASGIYRYASAPGGVEALWFGVVMGAIAGGSSLAFFRGWRALGIGLGAFAVLTVGGWFVYEALIQKGLAVAERRQLALIVLSVVVGGVLVREVAAPRTERSDDVT